MRVTLQGKHFLREVFAYNAMALLLPMTFCNSHAHALNTQGDCDVALEHAQTSLEEEKAVEATALIQAALPQCPSNAQAYALLGVSFDEQSRYGEAHRAFLRAIALNPTWAPFHNNLAVSYLHGGEKAAAMAEFHKVLRLEPNNRVATLNLATYYIEQKEFNRALELLEASKVEGSGDPDLLVLLTRAYLGVGSSEKASRTAQELSTISGDNAKLHFSLGLLFAEQGQPAEAIRQFQLIPMLERDYETYQNLGLAYTKVGDQDGARASFEAAMRLAPQRPESYIALSRIYAALHQPDQAVFLLSEANKQAPDRTDVVFALAESLIRIKRFDQAENVLSDSIRRQPSNAMLWQARGDLFNRQHLDEQALAAYQKSLQIDPKWIDSRVGLAQIYQRTGKIEQARTEYEAVLHVAPHSVQGNTGMGDIAFQSNHLDEATTYLERAFADQPGNSEAGELLATIRVREGKYTEADGLLRKLIVIDPDNARIHYLEGRVLVKLGRNDDSQLEFEKARQLTSNSSGPARQ
jgi:tetratricopeptide (TPR) repeat protein